MALIQKLKKEGETIYPVSVTDAIINPSNGEILTNSLDTLEEVDSGVNLLLENTTESELLASRTFTEDTTFSSKNITTTIRKVPNVVQINVESKFRGEVYFEVYGLLNDGTGGYKLVNTTSTYTLNGNGKIIRFNYTSEYNLYFITPIVKSGDATVGAVISIYSINNQLNNYLERNAYNSDKASYSELIVDSETLSENYLKKSTVLVAERTFDVGTSFNNRSITDNSYKNINDAAIKVSFENFVGRVYFDVYDTTNTLVLTTAIFDITENSKDAIFLYKKESYFWYINPVIVSGDGTIGDTISVYNRISELTYDLDEMNKNIDYLSDSLLDEDKVLLGYRTFDSGKSFASGSLIGNKISDVTDGYIIVDIDSTFEGTIKVLAYNSASTLILTTDTQTIDANNKSVKFKYQDENPFYYIAISLVSGDATVGATISLYKVVTVVSTNKESWSKLDILRTAPLDVISREPGMASIIHSWGFIGDSLSSGTIERVVDGVRNYVNDRYEYSWPQRLCRLLGVEGYNFSNGGQTCAGWINGTSVDPERTWIGAQTNLKDAYIIALGVNDSTTGSVDSDIDLNDFNNNANTFAGNYAGIIQRLRSINPSCYIFCVTLPTGGDSKNPVIRSIVDKFSRCYLIDLEKYAPSYSGTFVSNYYSGGHLNAMGYQWTAFAINTYIDWVIRNNYSDFIESSFVEVSYTVSGTITYGSSKPAGLGFKSMGDNGYTYVKIQSDNTYKVSLPNGTYNVICDGYTLDTTSIKVESQDVTLNLTAN